VLCEKPFSTKLDEVRTPNPIKLLIPHTNTTQCEKLLATAARHPDIKLMCGFSRRFDASYRAAHARTAAGAIGRPTILRSQTCDMVPQDWTFFVEYAAHSGGIFVDCNIHDIDLALWFSSAPPTGRRRRRRCHPRATRSRSPNPSSSSTAGK
jgi:myo-inositol 2-dehydrogenase/D-chiro-inositol 1-dehydrogenase